MGRGDMSTTLWGVHNFGIRGADKERVRELATKDLRLARDDPLQKAVFFLGDFNYMDPGDPVRRLADPLHTEDHKSNQEIELWESLFSAIVKVYSDEPTHF